MLTVVKPKRTVTSFLASFRLFGSMSPNSSTQILLKPHINLLKT